MDSCILEVPLDISLQKDRLKLVNKGSLSKRRKPSRYAHKSQRLQHPKIVEPNTLGKHITTVQITATQPTLSKRESRRRAHSESRLIETPDDLKKRAEIKKSSVLIQTWERRSQSDLKRAPPPHETNGPAAHHKGNPAVVSRAQPKPCGKENRQSWKPVHNMPDPISVCATEKENLRNTFNGYNRGNSHAPGSKHRQLTIPSGRLIRPKSMCAINGSSNEEPEWISLSRKLCAKFVQSHLDTESVALVNGAAEKARQDRAPTAKFIEVNKKENCSRNGMSRFPVKENVSGPPPWINLSRKLCNKFIEDHKACDPRDVDLPKPLSRTKSVEEVKCNVRSKESVERVTTNRSSINSKEEPEWVKLSRRLRAKFIEGHKDDPDTICLDNQLNASDLEDYCLDIKFNQKNNRTQEALTPQKEKGSCKSTLTLERDFKQDVKKVSSTVSFCYWSDIKPCETEIYESGDRNKSISNGFSEKRSTKTTVKDSKDITKENNSNSCIRNSFENKQAKYSDNCDLRERARLDGTFFQDYEPLKINNHSTPLKSQEYQVMGQDFEISEKIENHQIECDSTSNVDDDVNYELTFEAFETADNVSEKDEPEEGFESRPFNGCKLQSKSLCNLSHYEPDSLEYGLELNDMEYRSSNSDNKSYLESSVSLVDIARHSTDDVVMYENISGISSKSKSLVIVDGFKEGNYVEDAEHFEDEKQVNGIRDPVNKSYNYCKKYSHSGDMNNKTVHEVIDADLRPVTLPSPKSVVSETNGCNTQITEPITTDVRTMNGTNLSQSMNKIAHTEERKMGKNEKLRSNRRSNATRDSRSEPLSDCNSITIKYEESHAHRFYVSAVSNGDTNSLYNEKHNKCNGDNLGLSENNCIYSDDIPRKAESSSDLNLSREKGDKNKNVKLNNKSVVKPTMRSGIITEDKGSTSGRLSNGQIKTTKHTFLTEEHRSVELLESHPGSKAKSYIAERINGKRESLKEFDIANESYQSINPPFEFDSFEMPALCSPENRQILKLQEEELYRNSAGDYSKVKIESSDSETPNSTPFDSRTLVSPSLCPSDSDTSSWTLTKNDSYGRNHSSLRDTDFSDCSLSVRCNDTPSCSNQSTMESCKNNGEASSRNKHSTNRYSEVFVDCETRKNWTKTRSLDHLEERHSTTNGPSNVYANVQDDVNKSDVSKSNDDVDSTSAMPESLRHLFNLPRTHIYTPTAKTSMLLSKSSEPLPCHYYSSPPLSSSKKENGFPLKPKTERSSSIKIKDIAQGIILTFRKFHSHSKTSQLSTSEYVDVSHLAESGVSHKDFCNEKQEQMRVGQDIQRLSSTEYGKIASRRISAGYFGHRSTSESNLHLQSAASQLCTCKELPSNSSKKTSKDNRPKSFNFGMISETKKNKASKKTPEMKEKKSKNYNGKGRSKKGEQRSSSSVSRKVQQMADGTLCLVTTVSGDTAVPGVYSQDTSSEISTHAPVKQSGESNC